MSVIILSLFFKFSVLFFIVCWVGFGIGFCMILNVSVIFFRICLLFILKVLVFIYFNDK